MGNIQARLYQVNMRVMSVNNAQNLGGQFIDSVKNLLITFYCARAVIQGDITFGVMISTQFIIGMLNGPVVQFIQFIASFQFAQISSGRLSLPGIWISEGNSKFDITHDQFNQNRSGRFGNISGYHQFSGRIEN